MIKGIIQDDAFYCNHLGSTERDEKDIPSFYVALPDGKGLQRYIRYYAFPEEDAGLMRTYIIRDINSDDLVGYFSLKAGLISINEIEGTEKTDFDTVPGIEVANFAVNSGYMDKHPEAQGSGILIFTHFIQPIIRQVSREIGVKVIYLFALPVERLIARYSEYGFQKLSDKDEEALHKRLKPTYDDSCIFMYKVI